MPFMSITLSWIVGWLAYAGSDKSARMANSIKKTLPVDMEITGGKEDNAMIPESELPYKFGVVIGVVMGTF